MLESRVFLQLLNVTDWLTPHLYTNPCQILLNNIVNVMYGTLPQSNTGEVHKPQDQGSH